MFHQIIINTLLLLFFTLINFCITDPIVTTKFGRIQGLTGNHGDLKYEAFLGIPFAKPPLGDLRFQKPQPFNSTWSKPFEAVNLKDGCIQKPSQEYKFNISEDCLYLNIWRPTFTNKTNSELLPVFYYIHASGFAKKSAALPVNQGDVLSATQNIIVVNSNYRLGALGFAYGSHSSMPGNLGIYDALTVLQWIRDNIESFGGDPNRVTLAGQSSGSVMTSILATLPDKFESQSLFSRLIMMSGAATNQIHADKLSVALAKTRLLASKVNCSSQFDQFESFNELSDETINCLKKADANDLLNAQNSDDILVLGSTKISAFFPVYGTDLIPDYPIMNHAKHIESIKDKPMLFGKEQDEAPLSYPVSSVFTLSDGYAFTKKWITFSIKDIKNDQVEDFYNFYFNDTDPNNVSDIRSRCVKICSDMIFNCPALVLAEFFSQINPNIHYYLNSYVGEKLAENPGRPYGTQHGDDVKFGLGDPIRQYNLYTSNDRKFSRFFLNLFGNFTNGINFTDWPAISVNMSDYESLQTIKQLNLSPTNILDHDQHICIKWAELSNYSIPELTISD